MVETVVVRSRADNHMGSARDKLIVALDVPTVSRALDIVDRLRDTVSFYKISLYLQFDKDLHKLFRRLLDSGKRIFVDYKSFDIPETVEGAIRMASDIGISFITVVGQRHIVEAAVRARSNSLKILAVTLLTNLNQEGMRQEYNTEMSIEEFIKKRARYAASIGCDGVISSALEIGLIRRNVERNDFLIVTPGIRMSGEPWNNQKRVATPYEAIQNGADYLVVGRPIIQAPNPEQAALRIIQDMESAMQYSHAYGA